MTPPLMRVLAVEAGAVCRGDWSLEMPILVAQDHQRDAQDIVGNLVGCRTPHTFSRGYAKTSLFRAGNGKTNQRGKVNLHLSGSRRRKNTLLDQPFAEFNAILVIDVKQGDG
ncbi:MAG: hypothetical protein ABSE84_19410, partial [Isosphaeraceae bacterium]